jgi:hypothetical protein
MENVPALKNEGYTSNLADHLSKIDFQLSAIKYPDQPVKPVLNNWVTVSEQLMKDPNFGEQLTRDNNWLDDETKTIARGSTDKLQIAKYIYAFVRDNFTCNENNRFYLSNPLKKTFQSKSGNVADVNLLLAAMMINRGIEAHPVILSTRGHSKVDAIYPFMDKFNYVVTEVKIDEKSYLLDASHNKLGFGKLSSDSYNGYARVVDKMPLLLQLPADSLKEKKVTTVLIFNDEKEGLTGSFTSTLGHNESYSLREKFVKMNTEEYFKDIKKSYSFDIDIKNTTVDSLKAYEEPVTIKYDFKFDASDDIIYLNPVLTEAQKENPFKAAERNYPIEMPYSVNETYVLRMDVPKGYKVEEMPRSARVKLNEDEGMFEYLVSNSGGIIQLRSRIELNKATFLPEDYQALRDFFGHVVKKHSEQIVLKKIK